MNADEAYEKTLDAHYENAKAHYERVIFLINRNIREFAVTSICIDLPPKYQNEIITWLRDNGFTVKKNGFFKKIFSCYGDFEISW